MNKFLAASLAGGLATGPMTATMMFLRRRLHWHERQTLPPKLITTRLAKRVGIAKHMSEEENKLVTWASHFAFGTGAGTIYGPIAAKVKAPPIVKGTLFGLLVWAASYRGWLPASRILYQPKEQPTRLNWIMVVAHLVWGASLGILTDKLGDSEDIEND